MLNHLKWIQLIALDVEQMGKFLSCFIQGAIPIRKCQFSRGDKPHIGQR